MIESHAYVWSERFWLPGNMTWTDLQNFTKGYELQGMMRHCIFIAFTLSFLRVFITSFLLIPLGSVFGLKPPKRRNIASVPLLESIYSKNHRPKKELLESLSTEVNMPIKAVEFWFHKRRNLEKKPCVIKFAESGWRLFFYSSMFFYGLIALYDKDYFYDVKLSLVEYPAFKIPDEIYWYYAIELAYYISEMFWVFHGVRRSDFYVLLIHHMATVGLLSFSYVINHHRIGALILILHDVADCWMESAKMFKYVKRHDISEKLFAIFVVVWILTRLCYFPFWIIYTIFTAYPFPAYPTYHIIVSWLMLLQIMHIYWFYLIAKIVVQVKMKGETARDCRSDSDTSDDVNYNIGVSNGVTDSPNHQLPNGNGTLPASSQVFHRKLPPSKSNESL